MSDDDLGRPWDGESADRVAVLLGAGASADAGLLLTSELASAIVEKANQPDQLRYRTAKPDWVRALNAVYAGMVGYQGARGDNPLSAVNIETLVSAVRLLRRRDTHEVAPFVASWAPSLSSFGSSDLPTTSGKAVLDAVGKAMRDRRAFADRNVTEAVANIARAAVRPDLEKPFADAETFILSSLVDLLGRPRDVSYFGPLLQLASTQRGGVDVITLNYDLTVELAAAQRDITVNRGVESWRPGESMEFPTVDGTLNLLKLHGSLDWHASPPEDKFQPLLSPVGIDAIPHDADRLGRPNNLPWIVVGDREKLATDGPTLALNFAARSALLRATHLAVVGYSFGDAHVNAMIRDWLAGDPDRTMSILDLQWPRERYYREIADFRSALVAGHGKQHDHLGRPRLQRVIPIEGSAGERLDEVLAARPRPAPDPLATVVVARDEHAVRFDVTWHGMDLSDAEIVAWPAQDDRETYGTTLSLPLYEVPPVRTGGSRRRDWARALTYNRWPAESALTVYATADTVLPVKLEVNGASITGAQRWTGRVGDEAQTASEPSWGETETSSAAPVE